MSDNAVAGDVVGARRSGARDAEQDRPARPNLRQFRRQEPLTCRKFVRW
jgi:hypothetical protein